MYKLCFFVPPTHLEQVKAALFAQGAGATQHYTQCCWQVLGEGQFQPLSNSTPYLGTQNQLHKVAEYKVEMICQNCFIHNVVQALLDSHPYQQPAYEVYPILSFDDLPGDIKS